jgi:urease accessory protein
LLAGATAPNPQVITLRVLAHRIEPVAALLRDVWTAWRHEAWDLRACTPRVWAT